MMRLAITGCGGVGKALINLLDSRRGALAAEGLDIQVNYVLEYYGGIYNKDGIDLSALFEFVQNEKDITKFARTSPSTQSSKTATLTWR